MPEAVRVRSLTRRFGDFTAVDRVSFDVAGGEIFGFLGPNGAGKTTVIKMLTGLLRPSGGEARVVGFDVTRETAQVKRNIGYMSQLFSLYADLSVNENIELFGGLYGVTGDRLAARGEWVRDMAGLTEAGNRPTGELPLGWKQRLALGCAVLHEPSILFLDEPTSGVDPVSRRRFWDLIYELAESGTTVFVSTHYMEEAEYCYRLALMNRGRLIALDRPAELKRTLHQPLLELRTDDAPRAVEALQATPGVVTAALFGRAVHVMVEDAAAAIASVPGVLAGQGLTCESLEEVPPSLEDVFVGLVLREEGVADA